MRSSPRSSPASPARDPRVTSTLVGASSVEQLRENAAALDELDFTAEELAEIDLHATESGINLWARSSAGDMVSARASRDAGKALGAHG
jgi:hypothetical protein